MTRRCDVCPQCGNAAGINQIKGKDGLFYGICFKCGFRTDKGFPKRIQARYYWNSLPREHSLLTHDEYLLGTGQHWTQVSRRHRAKYFEENNIAYDPVKLVPLDPKIRTNPTSSVKQKKKAEYKRKVEAGELPKPVKKKKKK